MMCEVELQSGGASEMSNAEVIASRLLTFNQMYSYDLNTATHFNFCARALKKTRGTTQQFFFNLHLTILVSFSRL